MTEISEETVNLSINNIKSSQNNLDMGILTAKKDELDSLLLILKECWQTVNGEKRQKRLEEISNTNLETTMVEELINEVKEGIITANMLTETRSYH